MVFGSTHITMWPLVNIIVEHVLASGIEHINVIDMPKGSEEPGSSC